MKNKVLVKVIIPEIEEQYDIFIPVNEVIWKIKKLIIKASSDLSNTKLDMDLDYVLMNKENSRIYNNNEIVIDTDIRNASELIIFSKI